ncbi:ABC transporter permease [Prosthecomicrobium hirschii]|uniref:amino acid ABC transporter permease n=1 Tax=Prosthecodimorpha hirschii TaxID=665126 RepID=UPI00112C6DE4|nr:amino acid ABC transporter permease [Prosthecomicrobium hirschii]TPQ50149.1 ABC transporter permease [Prosthecomicrobium hirschii]
MYELSYDLIFGNTYGTKLLAGIRVTLFLFGLCFTAAFLLAVAIATLQAVQSRILSGLLYVFVEYQRNVPLLVHLLVWYFGIANLLPPKAALMLNRYNAEFIWAALALTLYYAAFLSEDLRSGMRAIPRGQFESAWSLGLNWWKTIRLVILPQIVRVALPPTVNQALSLFKNTSVAAALGVAELMYRTREIATDTFRVFEAFSVATAIYATGSLAIVWTGLYLERRLRIPTGAGAR